MVRTTFLWVRGVSLLAHDYFYMIVCLSFFIRDHAAIYLLAVNGNALDTFFHVLRICHMDLVIAFAESSGERKITKIFRYTRINRQTLVCRVQAKNVLGDIDKCPCSGSG